MVKNNSSAGGDIKGFFRAMHWEVNVIFDGLQCLLLHPFCFITEDIERVLCSVFGIGKGGWCLLYDHRCGVRIVFDCFLSRLILSPLHELFRTKRSFFNRSFSLPILSIGAGV